MFIPCVTTQKRKYRHWTPKELELLQAAYPAGGVKGFWRACDAAGIECRRSDVVRTKASELQIKCEKMGVQS